MVDIARIMKGYQETRVENDHRLTLLRPVHDCIDLFAQPFIAVGVCFRLKVSECAAFGMGIGAREISLEGFVNQLADSFAG
jgi:hypothetical protein